MNGRHYLEVALESAIKENNINTTRKLILLIQKDDQASLTSSNTSNESFLYLCIKSNFLAGFDFLFTRLKREHQILNLKSERGYSLFHAASTSKHVYFLEQLLPYFPDYLESTNDGSTPIHLAAKNKFPGILIFLLNRLVIDGKDREIIDAYDNYSDTALHLACCAKHAENIKSLIRYGADFELEDFNNKSAIDLFLREKDFILDIYNLLTKPQKISLLIYFRKLCLNDISDQPNKEIYFSIAQKFSLHALLQAHYLTDPKLIHKANERKNISYKRLLADFMPSCLSNISSKTTTARCLQSDNKAIVKLISNISELNTEYAKRNKAINSAILKTGLLLATMSSFALFCALALPGLLFSVSILSGIAVLTSIALVFMVGCGLVKLSGSSSFSGYISKKSPPISSITTDLALKIIYPLESLETNNPDKLPIQASRIQELKSFLRSSTKGPFLSINSAADFLSRLKTALQALLVDIKSSHKPISQPVAAYEDDLYLGLVSNRNNLSFRKITPDHAIQSDKNISTPSFLS